MLAAPLTKQFLVDATGRRVAVVIPIEEYYQLLSNNHHEVADPEEHPLYGALAHLGPITATTEEIDETLRELWSTWDREE